MSAATPSVELPTLQAELRAALGALPPSLFGSHEKKVLSQFLGGSLPASAPKGAAAPMVHQTEVLKTFNTFTGVLSRAPKLKDPRVLADRFALSVLLGQAQGAAPAARDTRSLNSIFGRFAEFAARFVSLSPPRGGLAAWKGALLLKAKPLAGAERAQQVGRFVDVLRSVGLDRATDVKSQQGALERASLLLNADSPRIVEQLARETNLVADHEPTRPTFPAHETTTFGEPMLSEQALRALSVEQSFEMPRMGEVRAEGGPERPAAETAAHAEPTSARPPLAPAAGPQQQRGESAERGPLLDEEPDAHRPRVLGPNFVWNFLHRFRDSAQEATDEARQAETLGQLVFTALLVLCGGAVIVIVLVSL